MVRWNLFEITRDSFSPACIWWSTNRKVLGSNSAIELSDFSRVFLNHEFHKCIEHLFSRDTRNQDDLQDDWEHGTLDIALTGSLVW